MRFGWTLAGALLLGSMTVSAEPVQELRVLAEHPVEGMRGGNLSGLAMCGNELWTVSDRDDDQIYRLQTSDTVWQAQAVHIDVPPVPDSGLPWGLRSRTWAASFVRGGDLDFEGITCDAVGNRYIVSEAHAAVLQVPVNGAPEWLKIAPGMVREARASGMLLHFNALFEGLAINPADEHDFDSLLTQLASSGRRLFPCGPAACPPRGAWPNAGGSPVARWKPCSTVCTAKATCSGSPGPARGCAR